MINRRALEEELRLSRQKLGEFEKRHGFSSAVFVKRFESGKLGDDREWFDWLGEWEVAKATHQRLAATRGPRKPHARPRISRAR